MAKLIEPKVLKGFRDMLPDREAARLAIVRKLADVFRSHGFAPIDTPVLEYAEVLLGKGGGETDKQVYRFTDHGGRDVAMRYDLTVPFARFMAAHLGELALPFKRWHAAKAWRGENTQRGRYREFLQVDFDTVGTDSVSADLEILLLIRESFLALGLGGVKVYYAHRGVFNAFLTRLGLAEKSVEVLRTIDKERKIGPERTRELLTEVAGAGMADRILAFARIEDTTATTRAKLAEAAGADAPGIERLAAIGSALENLGVAETFVLDPSITRGLDYYTGVVYETFLDRLPADRLRLRRRPVRRPRLPLHLPAAARSRRLHRRRPPDGRHGGARRGRARGGGPFGARAHAGGRPRGRIPPEQPARSATPASRPRSTPSPGSSASSSRTRRSGGYPSPSSPEATSVRRAW